MTIKDVYTLVVQHAKPESIVSIGIYNRHMVQISLSETPCGWVEIDVEGSTKICEVFPPIPIDWIGSEWRFYASKYKG
jgi:hypothetical protein